MHCCQRLRAVQAGFPRKPRGLRDCVAITNFKSTRPPRTTDIELSECRMADLKADIVVLGAGMVGVGAALHLQKRGRNVMLLDKHGAAGEETSYGNAGIIESASVFLRTFPRDPWQILRYASNRVPEARYRLADLPALLPWLMRYY